MAIVRKHKKPTYFIIFTCNPKWEEITKEVPLGLNATHRPDIVVRIFNIKLYEFLDDILKYYILGRVIAHAYVIEFQKRGLPHAYFLLIIYPFDRISNSPYSIEEDVNKRIRATIPNLMDKPELYKAVVTHMIHR